MVNKIIGVGFILGFVLFIGMVIISIYYGTTKSNKLEQECMQRNGISVHNDRNGYFKLCIKKESIMDLTK